MTDKIIVQLVEVQLKLYLEDACMNAPCNSRPPCARNKTQYHVHPLTVTESTAFWCMCLGARDAQVYFLHKSDLAPYAYDVRTLVSGRRSGCLQLL